MPNITYKLWGLLLVYTTTGEIFLKLLRNFEKSEPSGVKTLVRLQAKQTY